VAALKSFDSEFTNNTVKESASVKSIAQRTEVAWARTVRNERIGLFYHAVKPK
jgi:hypothetical protein